MPSILDTVRDLERLRQIVLVLVRHGFGEVVQRTGLGSLVGERTAPSVPPQARVVGLGERVRLVLTELGPSFVKLGQIASTRPDLVPEDVVRELKSLQDRVPPVAFAELKPTLETELGATLDTVFETFDETPLASASIGQVHRATLRTEQGVVETVVKVQRPNIGNVIERDLDLLHWLARTIERSIPESRVYAPTKLVAEFDRAIRAELDYQLEADNAGRFARNFDGVEGVRFPHVYREASTRRVMTLEFLDGKKVYDAIEHGASGEQIAKRALAIVAKQVFEDGFFHADPHPGNVIILGTPSDPVIGLIDLGLVGRLSPQMRDKTVDLMVAAVREDARAMADALYAIGRPTKKIDRAAFEAEVALLSERYLGRAIQDIELSALIRDLVQGAVKFGIEVPPDFLMVGKTLMTIEGIGKEVYPELDVLTELKPFFLDLLQQRYSPERLGEDLLRNVTRLGGAAADLPMQVQEILEDLRKGTLRVRIEETSLAYATDRLGRRLFSGLVISALVLAGAILMRGTERILGGLLLSLSGLWLFAHLTRLALIRRKPR